MPHFPLPHPAWEHSEPGSAGLEPTAIGAAAQHAAEHETPWSRDLARMVTSDFGEAPPWNEPLGPVRPRGGPNGLLLRGVRDDDYGGRLTTTTMAGWGSLRLR